MRSDKKERQGLILTKGAIATFPAKGLSTARMHEVNEMISKKGKLIFVDTYRISDMYI